MRPDQHQHQEQAFRSDESSSSVSSDPDGETSDLDRSLTLPDILTTFTDVGHIQNKSFNDMVHTHLELPDLCCKIINTPQFQRLRNLKQLGVCNYVYPSSSHNRFEHCIGTSYLSGKYCKILNKHQPELGIDEKDILCLYIAGLCHDLGHGPFSHTWEQFMHLHKPDYSHEEMSIRMLDFLIEDNRLWGLFMRNGLDETDLVFIKELILGHPLTQGEKVFQGRKPNKYFLYQIVSNDETKIDVDKFDYIMRDCKQLNVTTSFDYERVLDNSRVFGVLKERDDKSPGGFKYTVTDEIDENTETKIVYRKKIKETLEDLFKGRFSLHQKAYQHRVTMIIEKMVLDGLKAAEASFKVKGRNGREYKLSTAHEDISAFMKLTDSVFEQVINWDNGGEEAKRIFENIQKRNLYKCIGHISTITGSKFDLALLEELKKVHKSIELVQTKINYGKGSENPLNAALFYEKKAKEPNVLFTCQFRNPQEEAKCFILIRPEVDQSQIEDVFTLNVNQDVESEVTSVLAKYGLRLETE